MDNLSYEKKESSYYSSYRDDVFNVISDIGKFKRVLEVGCGNGALLHNLKKNGIADFTIGLDPYGHTDDNSNIDKFYSGTVEQILPVLEEQEKFDLIIFADVLEHLEDPWKILNEIVTKCLSPNAYVVISLPNFRNIWTLSKIIFTNSFKYEIEGVLDKTHLRFFCKNDTVELLEYGGLEVKLLTPNFKHKEAIFFKKNRLKYINLATLNIMPFWISDQIIAVGKKR